MVYREMREDEAEKIKLIDAACFIRNVWRRVDGEMRLVEINWTEKELPNGLAWHMSRYRESIRSGGKAYGCFDGETLVGYATVNADIFGASSNYVLLDQLFVSKNDRGKGIGTRLFELCKERALKMGADKLYLCAASSEATIAFYQKRGCVAAAEVNQKLFDEDPNDIPLEMDVRR